MSNRDYHKPVLLAEVLESMDLRHDGTYVDVTFGGGGHSGAMLERLGPGGKLFAFDQDADAATNIPDDERLFFIHSNFRYLKRMLRVEGVRKVDGILADIGVSSHQFDEGNRGFSYRFSGNLDMRMNQVQQLTAAEVIMTYSEEQLIDLFSNYGEVRNTKTLVRTIVNARSKMKINTIEDFLFVIEPEIKGLRPKYLAQVFQALRIEVNDEIGALKDMLLDAYDILNDGGILAVITFHSLEDRIVKNFFKTGDVDGMLQKDFYGNISKPWDVLTKKPVEASQQEIKDNPRARSARLRAARKTAG